MKLIYLFLSLFLLFSISVQADQTGRTIIDHEKPGQRIFAPGDINDRHCLFCHADPTLHQPQAGGGVKSLYVDKKGWMIDIHNRNQLSCVDCHQGFTPYSHPMGKSSDSQVDCLKCHAEVSFSHPSKAHQDAQLNNVADAPQCYDCHNKHRVIEAEDSNSSVNPANLQSTCGQCHSQASSRDGFSGLLLFNFSGHKKGNAAEDYDQSNCFKCHQKDLPPDNRYGHNNKSQCINCHSPQTTVSNMRRMHPNQDGTNQYEYLLRLFLNLGGLLLLGGALTLGVFKWKFSK